MDYSRYHRKDNKADLAKIPWIGRMSPFKIVGDVYFDEVAPKYADRNGGYARVLKTENRRGDNAPMAIVELV